MRNLSDIEQELTEEVTSICDKKADVSEASSKREVQYRIGELLNELRGHYESDPLFGEATRTLFEKMSERKFKVPNVRTLFRFRQLPTFGSLTECETVGFTNVYKLMEEKNAVFKDRVLKILANEDSKSEKKAVIKLIMQEVRLEGKTEEKFKAGVETEEDENFYDKGYKAGMADAAYRIGETVSMTNEYLEFLGVSQEDADNKEVIKYAIKSLTQFFHPDKFTSHSPVIQAHAERMTLYVLKIKEHFNL